MARYGMDYGRWGRGDRYDRDFGVQGRDRDFETGYGGYGGGYGGSQGSGYGGGSQGAGYGGYGGGYGGMRSDGWGSEWRNFPGESGWFGEASPGYQGGNYDAGYGTPYRRGWEGEGMNFDRGRGMQGSGYGGRETGYGGFDYEQSRSYGGGGGGRWGIGSQAWGGQQNDARAAELMTENPECVTPDTNLKDVARKMRELNVGIIPVVDSMDSRRLQGVITDRDIAVRAVAEGKDGNTTVRDCMTSDVETVNKNDRVGEVLNVMEREQVRRVPVTDREGRLVGIIAQADLSVDYARSNPRRERQVEDTIQRISEPARPRRGGMAAQGRGEAENSQGQESGMTGRNRSGTNTQS